MHHAMRLHPEPFARIRDGSKTSELRLNDEKRRLIQAGDTIEFTSRADESQHLQAVVTYVRAYPDFKAMYEGVRESYPEWDAESFAEAMREYYTAEEERQYGALEIGIRLAIETGTPGIR